MFLGRATCSSTDAQLVDHPFNPSLPRDQLLDLVADPCSWDSAGKDGHIAKYGDVHLEENWLGDFLT